MDVKLPLPLQLLSFFVLRNQERKVESLLLVATLYLQTSDGLYCIWPLWTAPAPATCLGGVLCRRGAEEADSGHRPTNAGTGAAETEILEVGQRLPCAGRTQPLTTPPPS